MAKPKKRELSIHSRAARRAASPVVDLDKSKRPSAGEDESLAQKRDILAVRQGAGVSKKKKNKHASRQQRVRQEKAMERAVAIAEQLERKVDKSKAKGKKVQSRSAAWDEVNGTAHRRFEEAARSQIGAAGMDIEESGVPDEAEEEADGDDANPDPRLALVDGPFGVGPSTASAQDLDGVT